MFMKPNMVSDKQGEFIIPVESIMKCEDFKSNFARKLSNRYTSRSSLSGKQDNSLKLVIDPHEFDDNASKRIEPCTQLSKSVIKHNGEPVKSPDKVAAREPAVRSTEVIALNRAVETLRWQLSQTEANRQMHIALLKQVVSFLNRVKEHIEYKKPETGMRKELPGRLIPGSFSVADLPRSRSVVQVNKNDYSLVSNKKNVSKKISKSISNVNGLKESNAAWNQSKLFLLSEIESKKKITEEMTRLITLANTVLSTHLPDLACNANDIHELTAVTDPDVDSKNQNSDSTCSLNTTDDETTNALILNTMCDSKDTLNGSQDNFIEDKTRTVQDLILNGSPAPDFENEFNIIKNDAKYIKKPLEMKLKSQKFVEKRNDYNLTSNFIEDESGFSSMSSFQEIGIPIISIIPPSPCKDVGYIDDITDMLEDNNNWRNDSKTLDKQAVKVFWV